MNNAFTFQGNSAPSQSVPGGVSDTPQPPPSFVSEPLAAAPDTTTPPVTPPTAPPVQPTEPTYSSSGSNSGKIKVLLALIPLIALIATGIFTYKIVNDQSQKMKYKSSAATAATCGEPSCPAGKTICDKIDKEPVGECKKAWWRCCDSCRPNEIGCDEGNYGDNGAVPTPDPGQTCNAHIAGAAPGTCDQCLTLYADNCVGQPWSATRYRCPNGFGPDGCNENPSGPIGGTIDDPTFARTICFDDFGTMPYYCGPGQIDVAIGHPNVFNAYTLFDFNDPNTTPPYCGHLCGEITPTPTTPMTTITITSTPTSTPIPTRTPTPTGCPLGCADLTYLPAGQPALGSSITLTCVANACYAFHDTYYNFRLIRKSSSSAANPNPLPAPFVTVIPAAGASSASTPYTFPQNGYGYYLFQCQVCDRQTNICSAWQWPNQPIPTPTSVNPNCSINGAPCRGDADCCTGLLCTENSGGSPEGICYHPTTTPTSRPPQPTATLGPLCGNGNTDPGEECDGTNQECDYFNGEECINYQCIIP